MEFRALLISKRHYYREINIQSETIVGYVIMQRTFLANVKRNLSVVPRLQTSAGITS